MIDETPNVSRGTPPRGFIVGDAVRLRGGVAGPFMSVIGLHLESVRCCWFDTNTFEVREAYFPAACLETREQMIAAAEAETRKKITLYRDERTRSTVWGE